MKTYFSKGRNYIANVNVNGKPVFVKFRDMGQYLNRGVFSTNDPDLAKALESSPRFNECFFLDGGKIEVIEEPKPRKYDYTYQVKRTQDAIRILVECHNIEQGTIKTRQEVLEKADELNIAFPNLTAPKS